MSDATLPPCPQCGSGFSYSDGTALTLDTLSKAAAAVGCTLRFELVAA